LSINAKKEKNMAMGENPKGEHFATHDLKLHDLTRLLSQIFFQRVYKRITFFFLCFFPISTKQIIKMMDYANSNSGGYMNTSFDGSSNSTSGYTRVSFTLLRSNCWLKNNSTETNG
jgi:hypothetical protein